jgi:hypothetical protein
MLWVMLVKFYDYYKNRKNNIQPLHPTVWVASRAAVDAWKIYPQLPACL